MLIRSPTPTCQRSKESVFWVPSTDLQITVKKGIVVDGIRVDMAENYAYDRKAILAFATVVDGT